MRRAAAALLALVLGPLGAAAAPLVADLSSREIAITTGFAGTELLLFGAVEGAGEVVVTVRGPPGEEIVRRKERLAGIWVNGASMRFADVPSFYRIAATRPLDRIASAESLTGLGIAPAPLGIRAVGGSEDATAAAFRRALIRRMQAAGLFAREVGRVDFVEGGLFRTVIHFPANVRTGTYIARVLMFRDGVLISSKETPLTVRRVGIESELYRFAHERSAQYGLVAIVVALVAGWLAGAIFRNT